MGRGWKGRTRRVAAGGAAVVLLAALWISSVVARRVLERALSAALGVPVQIAAVRPSGVPPRLLLVDVRVGAVDAPALSAERVYVRDGPWALLRSELRAADVEIDGARVFLAGLPALLARLGDLALAGGLASVRMGDLRIEVPEGAPAFTVSGFELRDLDVQRSENGEVALSGGLSIASASGRVHVDLGGEDGSPAFAVDVSVTGVPLDKLVRGAGLRLSGSVSGELWYEAAAEGAPSRLAGGDLRADGLGLEIGERELVAFESLRIEDATLDPDARVLSLGRALGSGGRISGSWLAEVVAGLAPEVETAAPWIVEVEAGRLKDVRVSDGVGSPPLSVRTLDLSEASSDGSRGWLALDASYAGGAVRLEVEREGPDVAGFAVARVEGLSLRRLLASGLGSLEVAGGELSGEVEVRGPPGLTGEGKMEARNVEVVVPSVGGSRPVLRATEIHVEADRLSAWPLHARLLRGRLVEPRVWIRHDRDGFELAAALAAASAPAEERSPLGMLAWTVVGRAGPAPEDTGASRPLGVRVSGGSVDVRDDAVSPPFASRLRHVDALLGGARGMDGPLEVHAAGAGPGRSRVRLDAQTSAAGESVDVDVEDARLRDYDSYVRLWSGYEVRGGHFGLAGDVRLGPAPVADLRLELGAVALEPVRGVDRPVDALLGAPLPAVLARLRRDHAPIDLDLKLVGDPEAPGYGFASALPAALRAAVDRALRAAPAAPDPAGAAAAEVPRM